MFEAQSLEKVHIDDGGAGRDDHIDHLVTDHVHIHLHTSGGRGRAGDGEDVGAILLGTHFHEDVSSTGGVARCERHVTHGIDKLCRVVFLDVDVLDGFFQKVFFLQIFH